MMYKTFYGLKERPFGKTPDPRFLFMAPQYEEALARLQYAVEEREIAVLTGEIGSGKTTLSRALMDQNDHDEIVLIVNPRLTPNQLLRELALRLDITPGHYRADLVDALSDRLLGLHEEGRGVVLIVDEAQLIPGKATFDELRLLSNFQLDTTNLISILLIGQPELRKRLAHRLPGPKTAGGHVVPPFRPRRRRHRGLCVLPAGGRRREGRSGFRAGRL
jgi:type II secretory pathway predicted ATPase ExeA